MPRYRVTIYGKDYDAMADLVREFKIDVFRKTARPLQKDRGVRADDLTEGDRFYSVDALIDGELIGVLERKGYRIERYEDVDKLAHERQQEVGKGDRYARQSLK